LGSAATVKRCFRLFQGTLTEGEGLNTFDVLVLASWDQVLFILKILFTFFTKQATLKRRLTVLRFPLLLVFPGSSLPFSFKTALGSFIITLPETKLITENEKQKSKKMDLCS